MVLRKMLNFSNILGITLPKDYTNAMKLKRGDYVEVYLRDEKTIVVKTHEVKPQNISLVD